MQSPLTFYQPAYQNYAIGAYSVNTMEQVLGIFKGAALAQAPVIIQISGKAHQYAGWGVLEAVVHAAARLYPTVPFAVHLDHGDEQTCMACIDSGWYSSVMIDASKMALAENAAITRRVVERAHAHGIAVEAELGRLAGHEDDVDVDESEAFLTDPQDALEFVRLSGCDSLAVCIGTSHGVNKFSGEAKLHLTRLNEIAAQLQGFPLVLHGASSVSNRELQRINAAGGAVDLNSKGVPEDQYILAARSGIVKINVDTDSRLVWTRAIREHFINHPANVDLREPGRDVMEGVAEMVVHHSGLFGCQNRVSGH